MWCGLSTWSPGSPEAGCNTYTPRLFCLNVLNLADAISRFSVLIDYLELTISISLQQMGNGTRTVVEFSKEYHELPSSVHFLAVFINIYLQQQDFRVHSVQQISLSCNPLPGTCLA